MFVLRMYCVTTLLRKCTVWYTLLLAAALVTRQQHGHKVEYTSHVKIKACRNSSSAQPATHTSTPITTRHSPFCSQENLAHTSSQLSTAGGLVCSSMRFIASSPSDSRLPPLISMSKGKLQGLEETTGGMCARFSFTCMMTSVSSPSSCDCRCAWRTLRAARQGEGAGTAQQSKKACERAAMSPAAAES